MCTMATTKSSHLPDLDDHDDGEGHDVHGHDADVPGPIDVRAWGAMILGVAAGLVIVLCLVLTTTILA